MKRVTICIQASALPGVQHLAQRSYSAGTALEFRVQFEGVKRMANLTVYRGMKLTKDLAQKLEARRQGKRILLSQRLHPGGH